MRKLGNIMQGRILKRDTKKPFQKTGRAKIVAKMRSSGRWQRLRALVLARSPLCVLCNIPAVEVHHIKEAASNPERFFDVENLAPLCERCHDNVKGAESRGFTSEQLFANKKQTEV